MCKFMQRRALSHLLNTLYFRYKPIVAFGFNRVNINVNIYIHISLQNFHDVRNVRVDQLHI